jgi:ABC-type nitrate/sulfonate/bicarbonate transport system permease component
MNRFQVLGVICPILLWEIVSLRSNSILVPSFKEIYLIMGTLQYYDAWHNLSTTIIKTLSAFLVANVLGIGCGYIVSLRKYLIDSVGFSVDFLRSLPTTSLFPLFMLGFGFNDVSKTILNSFGLFWIVFFNTIRSMQTLSKVKLSIFRSLGANTWDIFRHYTIFILLNNFTSIAKITLSMSLFITITFEMFIGSEYGIGKAIIDAKNYYEMPKMYFWILVAGMIGYVINMLVEILDRFFQYTK